MTDESEGLRVPYKGFQAEKGMNHLSGKLIEAKMKVGKKDVQIKT